MTSKASRSRSSDTGSTSPKGIDCAGTIVVANAAHHTMYGYRDGELIGRSILDFCATDEERTRQREYLVHLTRDRPPRLVVLRTEDHPERGGHRRGGLGLAAVLGIIRGHDATVKIHSHPGAGGTFQVLFPASRSATDAVLPAHSPSDEWSGDGFILVVDDDDAVRMVAKSMLETRGLSVLTACDGEEALAVYHDRSSDIVAVLLDLTMPRMNGEETFRDCAASIPTYE